MFVSHNFIGSNKIKICVLTATAMSVPSLDPCGLRILILILGSMSRGREAEVDEDCNEHQPSELKIEKIIQKQIQRFKNPKNLPISSFRSFLLFELRDPCLCEIKRLK
jgi:hypothetical protein